MLKIGKRNVNCKLRDCKEKVKVALWKSYNNYLTSLSTYNKFVKRWQAENKLQAESWKVGKLEVESQKSYYNIHFT